MNGSEAVGGVRVGGPARRVVRAVAALAEFLLTCAAVVVLPGVSLWAAALLLPCRPAPDPGPGAGLPALIGYALLLVTEAIVAVLPWAFGLTGRRRRSWTAGALVLVTVVGAALAIPAFADDRCGTGQSLSSPGPVAAP